ncbi:MULTISPECIES: hypothetical protein [unclassified Rathayibacter]|uniref:hypothetical protein n=1 Tax=unclassified Rathayibacter TaxID=2609250 RepID=UPI0010500939|nr:MULTISPECIES: hypothetical protein [unclassified Rathayibacter]TCL85617.1 hypothetical protein EDF49_101285 [Rathayibacter sp. PhB192]TCM31438.1 hypothetical protein EDF43_101285 [Rathayibacter sp. PhB179]
MSQHRPDPHGPTRRSVAASAVWGVPVVSAAVAAPLAAASPAPCFSTTVFPPASVASDPTVLTAISPGGAVSTVRITSVLAPGTTTESQGRSFDLTGEGSVWIGEETGPPPSETVARAGEPGAFGPGTLLLNQRRAGALTQTPSPGSDSQTLTFRFFGADGRPFDPLDVRFTFQNITSLSDLSLPWVAGWWTTIGFSLAPTSISAQGSDPGVGTGTVADPFRRSTSFEPVLVNDPRFDTFAFDVLPSGSTLTLSQHDGQQGWHSTALTALRFRARDC